MFELVKRDGRHERYDPTKLARSLTRVGVAPYMLAGILDTVAPNPDEDTGSLRASVEYEIRCWQPDAARRYAQTRRLHAAGSDAVAQGSVRLYPETAARLGVRTGGTVWLRPSEIPIPFAVEILAEIEPSQVWLNSADQAGIGIAPGTKLLVSGVEPAPPRKGPRVALDQHDTLVNASHP